MNLKLAYISLTLVMIIILIIIGKHAIDNSIPNQKSARKKTALLIIGLLLWQVFVFLTAYSGLLNNFDFPPRFALLLILPLFIFTGVFLYKNRTKIWLSKIPPHWLVFYQSFRIIIESIFVASVAQGILNSEVTIEGYNYDMVFGFTAPILGIMAYKKWASKKLLLVWNYLGLAVISVIIFLFLSSVYNPQLFGYETMILPPAAVTYPYVLVAGFLMPSAVFIHVLSIVQLRQKE